MKITRQLKVGEIIRLCDSIHESGRERLIRDLEHVTDDLIRIKALRDYDKGRHSLQTLLNYVSTVSGAHDVLKQIGMDDAELERLEACQLAAEAVNFEVSREERKPAADPTLSPSLSLVTG